MPPLCVFRVKHTHFNSPPLPRPPPCDHTQVVAALHQVYIRDGDADADGNSDDDPEPITEVTEMTMKNKAFGGGQ